MGNSKNNKDQSKLYSIIAMGSQVTVMLVGPVVFCLLCGIWLDKYFRTTPVFLIIGVIIGFAGSIFNVFRISKIMEKI